MYTDYGGKGGIKFDEIKVVSAYGKESMQNLIDSSRIQYISKDKEKTSRWIKRTRLQLPFGLTTTGYIDSIAQNQKNTTHVKGSKEITETVKDMIFYLNACGIGMDIIVGIVNMMKTDEEAEEIIQFLPTIPKEIYMENMPEAEEQVLAKALQITQNREIE